MRKHLLYLTNTQLTARMWQNGRLSAQVSFSNEAAGWQALSGYLSDFKHVPVFLLMDLIEEDFQRDTIPHVLGNTRKNLIERRLSQLYRDTPFRTYSHQGREKTSRKDDVMLFNALTNAPLIKPWIDAIHQQQVPLAGIFSAALLSTLLFKQFNLGTEPVLLITRQSSGMRQNFFQGGYLRFSRLIQLSSDEPAAIAAIASQEITKTRLFLANARLLQRGESLYIVAIDNPETLHSMQAVDTEASTYRYLSLNEAERQLGLKALPDNRLADTLLLALLAKKSPVSHYPLQEQSHTYMLWQLRILLYFLSAATVAGCVLWSSSNMLETIAAARQFNQQQQATLNNQQRYADIVASMPKTLVNPHDMKAAVDLHELLLKNNSNPKDLLRLISQVLDHMPQLRLDELSWEVSELKDLAEPVVAATPQGPATPPMATLIGLPVRPAEIAILKASVIPFEHNYRSALDSLNQLVAELKTNNHLQVSVVRLPLDTRSTVSLIGEAGHENANAAASFELKILWKP